MFYHQNKYPIMRTRLEIFSKPLLIGCFLLLGGLVLVGCDSSGSNSGDSGKNYEFEGLWRHDGSGFEHYLEVSGSEITKHEVGLDVDDNPISCDTDTQTIGDYNQESGMATLDGKLHDDGPKVEVKINEEGRLKYKPEDDDGDYYGETDGLREGAEARCG